MGVVLKLEIPGKAPPEPQNEALRPLQADPAAIRFAAAQAFSGAAMAHWLGNMDYPTFCRIRDAYRAAREQDLRLYAQPNTMLCFYGDET